MTRVYVITFCHNMDLLYGSTLVFPSIRTGFPNADLVVIDNGSIAEAIPFIQTSVAHAHGKFYRISTISHHDLLRQIVFGNQQPIAIVDPDVCFWQSMESVLSGMKPHELIAGRLIPSFNDPYTGCLTKARIHTSCLLIPDPVALANRIQQITNDKFNWDAFRPVMISVDGQWVRYDTLAGLMHLSENIKVFSDEDLECYDHLFCGSHIDWFCERTPDSPWKSKFIELHQRTKKDYSSLRGVWRLQNEFFKDAAKEWTE